MKKYITKKTVLAEPMDELTAEQLGYARPNEDNHEWRQGYHVLYPDGYHSWCPKTQFEASSQPAETFIDRLNIEYNELFERKMKLIDFMATKDFEEIPVIHKMKLERQKVIMDMYCETLQSRIGLFEYEKSHYNLKTQTPE